MQYLQCSQFWILFQFISSLQCQLKHTIINLRIILQYTAYFIWKMTPDQMCEPAGRFSKILPMHALTRFGNSDLKYITGFLIFHAAVQYFKAWFKNFTNRNMILYETCKKTYVSYTVYLSRTSVGNFLSSKIQSKKHQTRYIDVQSIRNALVPLYMPISSSVILYADVREVLVRSKDIWFYSRPCHTRGHLERKT